ncbi:Clp protease ClpP [Streptomyces sp. PA03-6a]|nr:Clp protease ClpP [Streptomyces sp. PA03-6a]
MSARHTRRDFLAAAQHMSAAGATVAQLVAAGVTVGPARSTEPHGEDRSWYRITNATSDDEAEMLIYDEIGGWWGTGAEDFVADLRSVTAPNLKLRINSPGGSVFEGITIANAIRNHPAQVTVQVDGIAASIASVIAMAGDRLVMMPQSTLMIHDASGVCMGNAADMQEMADLLAKLSDNIADVYASRAGGTRDEWRAAMQAESWYLAQEAVDAGLADEVGQSAKQAAAEPEMRQPFDLKAFGYTGGPAATEPEQQSPVQVQLHLDGKVLAESLITPLRNLIRDDAQSAADPEAPAEPTAEADPDTTATQADDTDPVEPEPVHDQAADGTEDDSAWEHVVAHLLTPDQDDWAALVSHLTTDASSSAATDA